jgi:hypothetical protein
VVRKERGTHVDPHPVVSLVLGHVVVRPLPVLHIVHPEPLVDIAVGQRQGAAAVALVLEPIALVHLPAKSVQGPPPVRLLALPVPQPVHEFALVRLA